MKSIFILGINSDIGLNISKLFKMNKYQVSGTARKLTKSQKLFFKENKIKVYKHDATNKKSFLELNNNLKLNKFTWDVIFSSIGTSLPIGRFFELDFNSWEKSINVNFTGQLKTLHLLYKFKRKNRMSSVVFLAGGGTNNPFRCYSAYCVSKIGLIKMCELIDDENKDIKSFIIGPGFVRTKTHLETINSGKKAEKNFLRVKKFYESKKQGTEFSEIFDCINWGLSLSKKIISGRNISVVHDNWGTKKLAIELKNDIDMYKLRRYKN